MLSKKMFQNTLLKTLAAAVLGWVWGIAWTNGFEQIRVGNVLCTWIYAGITLIIGLLGLHFIYRFLQHVLHSL